MEILHVSAECYPAAKVGGLGDVAGALPKYLNTEDTVAQVVIPHYHNKFFKNHSWETIHQGHFFFDKREYSYSILKESASELGFDLFITEIPELLKEELPYGYANDVKRHLGFQICVADWLRKREQLPDVVHCHDHPTGLLPFIMNYCYLYESLKKIPTVFTIHSGQYQGQFSVGQLHLIPHYDEWKQGMLEWNNTINPMACAIKCCWRFTTVSPGYLRELKQSALGLESLIVSEQKKGIGILNGIDTDVWNPETDKWMEAQYNTETASEGKSKNKAALCRVFNLDPERPLIVFIGRLVREKGGDVLAESIRQSVARGNGNVNFLVLGSGITEDENALNELKGQLPGNFNCYIGYHEQLAHLMYAGADFLLMPSRVEPCGLNQLYAMRYGTIPMVRSTGGLMDTVVDLRETGGFGIRFNDATPADIETAVNRAVSLFHDTDHFSIIRKQVMSFDHSWDQAAREYMNLYKQMSNEVMK